MNILGQIVSIIAMIITVLSFQFVTRGRILIVQTIGSLLFLVSYILLSAWSAVAINIIYLIRNTVYYFKEKSRFISGIWTVLFFCVACIVACILTYKEWTDVLTLIGAIFGCVALFMSKPDAIRLIKIGDSASWLAYNSIRVVIGGIICEIFNLISIIFALIKSRLNQKQTKNDEIKEDSCNEQI